MNSRPLILALALAATLLACGTATPAPDAAASDIFYGYDFMPWHGICTPAVR